MKRLKFLLYSCVLLLKYACSFVPSFIVSINPHPSGTFTVSISSLDDSCSENDLKKIVYKLGENIREEPRGLLTYVKQSQSKDYWCARFATRNIIYGSPAFVRLQEIVRGFCFYWENKKRKEGKIILYIADLKPHSQLIRYYCSPDVKVVGKAHLGPTGLEYVLEVNQIKADITIPEKVDQLKEKVSYPKDDSLNVYVYGVIVLTSLGLTCLLYYLARVLKNYFQKKKS